MSRDTEWTGKRLAASVRRDAMITRIPRTYTRRMRLSAYAIAAAVSLTLAAVVAMKVSDGEGGVVNANTEGKVQALATQPTATH